jgi:hypothetical protein
LSNLVYTGQRITQNTLGLPLWWKHTRNNFAMSKFNEAKSALGQKQNFKLKHYRNSVILDRKISSIFRSMLAKARDEAALIWSRHRWQ